MVELRMYALPDRIDRIKIHYPPQFGIEFASQRDFDFERMPVQPGARVAIG